MKKIIAVLIALTVGVQCYDRTEWIRSTDWKKARRAVLARDSIPNIGWIDPYTRTRIDNKIKVDIDHIIPLSYASKHCGENFSEKTKHSFATDPLNLLSVSQTANRSKGDKGLSEWLPKYYKCSYIKQWNLVSKKYPLCLSKEDLEIIKNNQSCKE